MPNPWFRLYHEFADDPKVQMMPEQMQRRLIMLFCSKCKDETLHETERAFHWRITETELAETKAVFLQKGFIDEHWNLLNWNSRQFLSDSATDRVRRFRQRKKQDETLQKRDVTKCNVIDTDTEQIQNRTDTDGPTVEEIVLAHPTPKSRGMTSFAIPTLWLSSAVDALAAGETREGLLAKVQAITQIVEGWPPGDMRFLKSPDRFFREREFNKPLAEWRENGASKSNTGVADHNREAGERALAELRRGRNAVAELPGGHSPSQGD